MKGRCGGHHTPTAPTSARAFAARWLSHPLSLAAIAVLVVNDHILKAQFGSWLTGKLSDVAGLVFFPALLAFVLAAASPRARPNILTRIALLATAAGPASPVSTADAPAAPTSVLRDPTDLIALVALPLTAWIASRIRIGTPGHRTQGVTRWQVAVVLPLAVIATAATGSPPKPSAVALQQVGGDWVLEVARGQPYNTTVHAKWIGAGPTRWADMPRPDYEPDPLEQTTISCADGPKGLCARTVPGRIAVEVSHDGGGTWELGWELSDIARDQLTKSYGDSSVSTKSVAVVASEGGSMVIAANGRDGLAIREVDGTWERVGFEGVPGVIGHSLVSLTDLRNPNPDYPVPPAITWAAFGAVLGLALVGGTAARIHSRRTKVLAIGVPLLAIAVGAAYWAVHRNYLAAVSVGADAPVKSASPLEWSVVSLVILAFAALALGSLALASLALASLALASLALGSLARGGNRGAVAGPAWGGTLTGLAAGAAMGVWLAGSEWWLPAQVTAVVAAAGLASMPWCLAMLAAHRRREAAILSGEPVEPLTEGLGAIDTP